MNSRQLMPAVLAFAGLSALPTGWALRLLVPGAWDPMWARGLICVSCLVLAELVRRRASRARTQLAAQVLSVGAAVWVVVLVWGNGFPAGASSGVLPLLAMCLFAFPSLTGAMAFTAAFASALVAAGLASDHGVHAAGLGVSCLVLGGVLSAASAHRGAMASRLRRARDHLEDMVAERTTELEHEVEVRRAAEARALDASEAKSRFLANMSHELRTPLNAIKGYAELCTEVVEDVEEGSTREELTRDLGRVTSSADRLLALVNDVLDLARIEADMLEMQLQSTPLPALLEQVADEVQPLVHKGGNALERAWDSSLPTVKADPARLRQILVNLLGNAAKFTDDGTIELSAVAADDVVEIAVRDTGIGIPEHALPTLFDRFTQVDESTTREHHGTGLGLALSRDLARQMGGDVSAVSTAGCGSTFTVRVPRA